MAVVVAREEVAIRAVADDPHVNPIPSSNILLNGGGGPAKEILGRAPAGGVVNVRIRGVGGVAVLEDEIPEFLGREVEDLGCGAVAGADGGRVEVGEGGAGGLGEVGEGQVDEGVAGALGGRGEDVVAAVRVDYGGIFDAGDVARVGFGGDERATGGPVEGALDVAAGENWAGVGVGKGVGEGGAEVEEEGEEYGQHLDGAEDRPQRR